MCSLVALVAPGEPLNVHKTESGRLCDDSACLIFESSVGLSTVAAAHVSTTRVDNVLLTLSSQIVPKYDPRHNMEAAYASLVLTGGRR